MCIYECMCAHVHMQVECVWRGRGGENYRNRTDTAERHEMRVLVQALLPTHLVALGKNIIVLSEPHLPIHRMNRFGVGGLLFTREASL